MNLTTIIPTLNRSSKLEIWLDYYSLNNYKCTILIIDSSNKKDEAWYNNTGITYAYDSSANKVKGTYGTAIAKAHADTLYTDDDVSKDVYPDDYTYASMRGKRRNTWVAGDVAIKGLKSLLIDQVKVEVNKWKKKLLIYFFYV